MSWFVVLICWGMWLFGMEKLRRLVVFYFKLVNGFLVFSLDFIMEVKICLFGMFVFILIEFLFKVILRFLGFWFMVNLLLWNFVLFVLKGAILSVVFRLGVICFRKILLVGV